MLPPGQGSLIVSPAAACSWELGFLRPGLWLLGLEAGALWVRVSEGLAGQTQCLGHELCSAAPWWLSLGWHPQSGGSPQGDKDGRALTFPWAWECI